MRSLKWLAAFVCGTALLAPAVSGAETVIRFATLTSINKCPPGIVSEEKGLFQKHGVKVQMQLFAQGEALPKIKAEPAAVASPAVSSSTHRVTFRAKR